MERPSWRWLLTAAALPLVKCQVPDGLLGVVHRLDEYNARTARNNEVLQTAIDDSEAGNLWSALRTVGDWVWHNTSDPRPVSVQDLGTLIAVQDLLQLSLTMTSRVLLAGGRPLDEGNREEWFLTFAQDVKDLFEAFPSGHRAVLGLGYVALYWTMISHFEADPDGMVRLESYSSLTQAWWLAKQAAPATVSRLCEVGFNAGHSSLAFLSSSPREATVLSFDLVSKSYTMPCFSFLSHVFPGRLEFVKGPSNFSIPEYARTHLTAPRCDIVYIDGGHEESEATADLWGMSLMADVRRTLVIMDDVGCDEEYCVGPTAAWEAYQRAGRLKELGCQAEGFRRWCWGYYL